MAGAILGEADAAVRLHAGSLHSLLILLDAERWLPDGARPLVHRWLADIDADLGYVQLSEDLLQDLDARDGLTEAVRDIAAELDDPGYALSPAVFGRVADPESLRRMMLAEAQRLLRFLAG